MARRIAGVLGVPLEWLLDDEAVGQGTTAEVRGERYEPNPTLRHHLPAEAHRLVNEYMLRLQESGVRGSELDEAERLLTVGVFSKRNQRDLRQRAESDIIADIHAAWLFITEVLTRRGTQMAPARGRR